MTARSPTRSRPASSTNPVISITTHFHTDRRNDLSAPCLSLAISRALSVPLRMAPRAAVPGPNRRAGGSSLGTAKPNRRSPRTRPPIAPQSSYQSGWLGHPGVLLVPGRLICSAARDVSVRVRACPCVRLGVPKWVVTSQWFDRWSHHRLTATRAPSPSLLLPSASVLPEDRPTAMHPEQRRPVQRHGGMVGAPWKPKWMPRLRPLPHECVSLFLALLPAFLSSF